MNSNQNYLIMLVSLVFTQALLIWSVGNVYVNSHEFDVLHAIEGALRVADGERPHLDFMTPLGVMTFAPSALLLNLGLGRGAALAFSGVMIAALAIPAVYWVGVSRLTGRLRWIWGASLILLITASIFGEDVANNSFSMYYNRWSWAVTFVMLTAVAMPNNRRKSEPLDGLVLGFGLAFLALCKITFFAGFFPGIALALLYKRRWTTIIVTSVTGIAIAIVVTIYGGGLSYWLTYIADLQFVQSVNLGDRNGGWSGYIATPAGTFAMAAVLSAAVYLSKSGNRDMAVFVLLFSPGFIYSTFHNWGVEPKFLIFLALMIWMGAKHKPAVSAGFAFLLIGSLAPVLINISLSNLRPLGMIKTEFEKVFETETTGALMFTSVRIHTPTTAMAFPDDPYTFTTIEGDVQIFPVCTITQGNVGQDKAIMAMITSLGLMNEGALVADAFSNYWMYGDFKRIKGAAIWQYGGAYGAEDAGILIVADCPSSIIRRQTILEGVLAAGHGLSLIEAGDRASIYRIVRR